MKNETAILILAQLFADYVEEIDIKGTPKSHAKQFVKHQTKWANEIWERHKKQHPNDYKETLNGYTTFYSYVYDIVKANVDALFDKPTSVVDFRDYEALEKAYNSLVAKYPKDGDVATIKRFLNKVPKVEI
jgi:hypothetical protein